MRLDLRVRLFQLADELLDLKALGLRLLVRAAGRAGIREFAGTLDKVQLIGVAPRLDVILADQIQRADQPIPSKFVLWSFGIIVCTCAPQSIPIRMVSITSS